MLRVINLGITLAAPHVAICMKTLIAAALTLLSVTVPAAAQQQPTFGERVDVNVVLLDTVVTDAKGNQILGLEPSDFVVKENGVEQKIDSAPYYTTRQLLNATEANAPFKVERVQEHRYFVIFFDKPAEAQLWSRLRLASSAAEDFVNRTAGPDDLVAVVGHDVRLKVYTDFTNDKNQIKTALMDASKFGNGILKPTGDATSPSILRNVDQHAMMSESGTVYEALEELAKALRPIRARKDVVLFSAGIHEPGEEVRAGVVVSKSRYYDPMIHALNAANVTVFAANLMDNPPSEPMFHQALESITHDTNGEYMRNAVSFQPILKQVAKSAGGYYLISYASTQAKGTSGFQKVDVSVRNHRELKVQARAGYSYGD